MEAGATTRNVWIAAAALAVGPAVGLGLARFAYALLLPAMRADLAWSFTQAGTINTANAIGYLVGAIAAAPVLARVGSRRLFLCTILVAGLTTLMSGATAVFWQLLLLRVIAGVAGALAVVAGAGMAAQLAHGRPAGHAGLIIGIYFGGAGLGIAVSGVIIPALLQVTGRHGWRAGWVVLGLLSFAAAAAAAPSVLRTPVRPRTRPSGSTSWRPTPIAFLLAAYALFGAGYISYMTFIIAFLKAESFTAADIRAFWVVLGLAAWVSIFGWGPLFTRVRGGGALALVTAVLVAGASLPLLSRSHVIAFASAVCFGGSFIAITTVVADFARRSHPPHHWNMALATLTVAFALGQCFGPVAAGVLSDGPSGVRAGLQLSVVILTLSTLLAWAQPSRDVEPAVLSPAR